jgi:hypothetical protein
MVTIPDAELYKYADRTKGKVVIITGTCIRRLTCVNMETRPAFLRSCEWLWQNNCAPVRKSRVNISFLDFVYLKLSICRAKVVVSDVSLNGPKGAEAVAHEITQAGGCVVRNSQPV